MKRRQALQAAAGSVVLWLGPARWAWAAQIVAVRVWPASDYTRLTIESDEPLQAQHFLPTDGRPRLVIDLDNLELSPALRELVGKVQANDPYIGGVRVGQFRPRQVRLVIDLKQAVRPQQFTLAPVAAYRHRLVFDLYPVAEADPLLALLRDKEDARRAAPPEADDALGEFIRQLDRRAAATPTAPAVPPNAPAGKAASSPALAARPGAAVAQERINRLIIVAIDPGHGGEDPGAIGPSGLREKDVVLQIASRLRERIDARPGMRAMLTRDGDYFIPLHERVRKARRVQADLFVSIHADAFLKPEARGASVFTLSQGGATSAAARWMANKENAADLVGGVNTAVKDAQVLKTLLDMSTTAQIKDSLRVGGEILKGMGKVGRLHRGRVEQAGFAVLKAPDIPSILVETAFISNPEEEAKLSDVGYQDSLADALLVGIARYFAKNPPLARNRPLA